jgi:diaminohydroxyphosphoribosylaminopyrimidine deaminase/5-amino-6-(5-phosphoribosylamino)uracil reductase
MPRGRAHPSDAELMRRALALGARGLGRTWPNPPVGALLVRGGRIVGEGFHARAGAPHAEIQAIRAAGARARGAELFVSLEPCTHYGRTPPCVEAVLRLGPTRVVVGAFDPNPRVRGRGIRRLRQSGVPVVVGVEGQAADALLAGFRSRITRGRPLVTLKLAVTLDGRIAARGGDARWITGAEARREAHGLRGAVDAVLVGSGTVRADDPRLTCRLPGGHDPLRIVLAGRGLDLPRGAHVIARGGPPTLVVAPASAAPARVTALRRRGVEVELLPADRAGRIPIAEVLAALGARGLTHVLVEGGAMVAAQLLAAQLADRVVIFVAPAVLGGDGVPALGPLGITRAADAIRLERPTVRQVGPDFVVEGVPRSRRARPLPPGGSRATLAK